MKTGKPVQELARMLLGLAIVAVITMAIISTLRVPAPGRVTAAPTTNPITASEELIIPLQEPITEVPYPYPSTLPLYYFKPDLAATQTAAGPLATQDAIMWQTRMAITPSPTPPVTYPPTGTYTDTRVQASGLKMGLHTQNSWFGLFNKQPVNIFAGALAWETDQGAIYLFMGLPEGGISELILTPTKHGAVRVVSEQKDRLTLVSTDGTAYYFDLPARRFVDSLTGVVPSATPLPTYTPFPPPSFIGIPTPYPAP